MLVCIINSSHVDLGTVYFLMKGWLFYQVHFPLTFTFSFLIVWLLHLYHNPAFTYFLCELFGIEQ